MKKLALIGMISLAISCAAGLLAGLILKSPSEQEPPQKEVVEVEISVPDVMGYGLDAARDKLAQSGLGYEVRYDDSSREKAGTVTAQFPQAESMLAVGQPVQLTVSSRRAIVQKVVCLDPGHSDTPSYIDPGTGLNTRDYTNEPEIQIVYDIASRAKVLLEAQGVKVVMTKQSVYDPVDLMQRAVIANQAGAALILHVHTDSGISAPTTFYPGGDAEHNWKGNTSSGRKAAINPDVQAASYQSAAVFHAAMTAAMSRLTGVSGGGLQVENRGATGTGNYGPIFSYDVWSEVPTFTIENNQAFADEHRQEVAQAIAEGIMACLQ